MQKYLMRLEDLERTEKLFSINRGGDNSMIGSKLTISVVDYRDVEIPEGSVIICDIPYYRTREYRHNKDDFDYDAFYAWAESQTQPVFVCEYWMPEDRFFCIAEFDRTSTFSATNNSMRVKERVFMPNKWMEWWERHRKHEPPKQFNLFDYED